MEKRVRLAGMVGVGGGVRGSGWVGGEVGGGGEMRGEGADWWERRGRCRWVLRVEALR